MVNSLNDGLNKPDQVEITENSTITSGADFSAVFQGGSVEPTAATAVVVTFDPAFASTPAITVTCAESGTGNYSITGASAGSFSLLGTSGIAYNWIAVKK